MTPARQPSSRTLRRKLVEELETAGALTDPAVRKAFLAVPRERFLVDVARDRGLPAVYVNKAIVIRTGDGGAPTSSSSQPAIMAPMLERLDLRPGQRVLEIGAGTGYNAALLSTLVGGSGHVTSVELEPDLAAAARAALAEGGHRVDVVVGDGRHGWPAGAPYDRIVATASTATVPRAWLDQLAPGGLVEAPLRLRGRDVQAVATLRRSAGGLRSVAVLNGGFMVLRGPDVSDDAAHLSVSEVIGGEHRTLGTLSGEGLGTLRPTARTRLARLLLERPLRRRRLGAAADGRSPRLFLRLARPRGAVTLAYFRTGSGPSGTGERSVATASTDGRGLAVLDVTGAGMHLECYGDPRPATVLAALLDEWTARGRPSFDEVVVDITFDPSGRSTMTTGWRPAE